MKTGLFLALIFLSTLAAVVRADDYTERNYCRCFCGSIESQQSTRSRYSEGGSVGVHGSILRQPSRSTWDYFYYRPTVYPYCLALNGMACQGVVDRGAPIERGRLYSCFRYPDIF